MTVQRVCPPCWVFQLPPRGGSVEYSVRLAPHPANVVLPTCSLLHRPHGSHPHRPVIQTRSQDVKQLQKPTVIDGMRVASLPDLLATKLDVIMYRPKLRDYIDIAAIDQSGVYTIEDGLRFHAERYGMSLHSSDLHNILRLLENPGRPAPDRVFADSQEQTLEYLKKRASDARRALAALRTLPLEPGDIDPPDRPSASRARSRCGAWMPVARAYCCLPRRVVPSHPTESDRTELSVHNDAQRSCDSFASVSLATGLSSSIS